MKTTAPQALSTSPLRGEVAGRRPAGGGDPSPHPARRRDAPAGDPPPPGEGGKSQLARAWKAAESVPDPEIPVLSIADLGVLRDIQIVDGFIEATITPTYSGCPAMNLIALNLELALEEAGFHMPRIKTVLSPAWTTDWLTPAARRKLAANGIAPPVPGEGRRALFAETAVTCPRCGSTSTERVSEFGSTACKAHYRCLACHEPFQYFKCV